MTRGSNPRCVLVKIGLVVLLGLLPHMAWADTLAAQLDKAVKQVAPIAGVSIGKPDDKATWKIHFTPEATRGQQEAAQAVLDAFVYNPNVKTTRELKRDALLADPNVPQSVKDWVAGQ